MLIYDAYRNKNICGTQYEFTKRGDGIPMHSHKLVPEYEHNVIVLAGSIQVYGPNKKWSLFGYPGDVIDFSTNVDMHEIAALEDNTKILNLYTNGTPVKFNDMPFDSLYGTEDDVTLTIPLEEEENDTNK